MLYSAFPPFLPLSAPSAAAVIIARIARGTPRAFIKKESKDAKKQEQREKSREKTAATSADR